MGVESDLGPGCLGSESQKRQDSPASLIAIAAATYTTID
jgi:hypothetical protein